MKDELQLKLVEILTSIQTAAGKASDFALDQLPDIAQSYIVYGKAVSIVQVIFSLAIFLVGAWLLNVVRKHVIEYRDFLDSNPLITLPGIIVGGILILVGLNSFAHAMSYLTLVWLAPKVWLLKEIASLLK